MSFGRKIASRIVLAYLIPAAILVAAGLLLIYLKGGQIRLWPYALGMAISLIPALLVGRLLTYSIGVQLGHLMRAASRIESGEYGVAPVVRPDNEFGDLARALSHVADVIAQRESAFREQNGVLVALNHRFEAVLNAANDGIAMLDREGHFVLINRRFGDLLGCRPEFLLHQTAEEAPPQLVERLVHLSSRLARLLPDETGEVRGVAEEIVMLDGPEGRALQFYTAPVQGEDGRETIGRIVALRDVTRERDLDKMKTDFISVVSHELRTPLTSIKGYTDLLLSGASGETNELQAEFLGIIQSSTTRLSNLINDILDISRIESGSIEIQQGAVDYGRIVSETLRLMKAAADEKGISLDASLPETIPPIRGDADKVTQILSNLVSNAIKYTPEGGWIKVSLEVTGEASLLTCIADSGIGIAPEDQKRLFQKFFRADNTSTREAGGTGLGLVIAKTILEMLGGAIWVESEEGRGSRFNFTLPLYLEAAGDGLPPIAPPERGIGLVLIVDDDAYLRSLIRHALHRRGYGTLEAADGTEALQKARWHKPDAVTLDMMMPDMDGLRALQALKGEPTTARIPVILVSVLGDPSRGDLAMGAFSFLCKPISPADLESAILEGLSARPAARKVVTICLPGTQFCEDIETAASNLKAEGIDIHLAPTPAEAVAYVITEAPGLILIDTGLADEDLFSLLTALKAEDEAARIPIVLMTDDMSQEGIHFHAGTDAADTALLLDYLCDQVSQAVAGRERPLSVAARTDGNDHRVAGDER